MSYFIHDSYRWWIGGGGAIVRKLTTVETYKNKNRMNFREENNSQWIWV